MQIGCVSTVCGRDEVRVSRTKMVLYSNKVPAFGCSVAFDWLINFPNLFNVPLIFNVVFRLVCLFGHPMCSYLIFEYVGYLQLASRLAPGLEPPNCGGIR